MIKDGKAAREDFPFETDGFKEPQDEFIDGVVYDARAPNAYLANFEIGLKEGDVVEDGGTSLGN